MAINTDPCLCNCHTLAGRVSICYSCECGMLKTPRRQEFDLKEEIKVLRETYSTFASEHQNMMIGLADRIFQIESQIIAFINHKTRQIDENRKVSRILDKNDEALKLHFTLIENVENKVENCFERIEMIEAGFSTFRSGINKNLDKLQERIESLETTEKIEHKIERIAKLEQLNAQCFEANPIKKIDEKFKHLEDRLHWIEGDIAKRSYNISEKKPYKCPICDGKGGFKDVDKKFEWTCDSCKNTGIVWSYRIYKARTGEETD